MKPLGFSDLIVYNDLFTLINANHNSNGNWHILVVEVEPNQPPTPWDTVYVPCCVWGIFFYATGFSGGQIVHLFDLRILLGFLNAK